MFQSNLQPTASELLSLVVKSVRSAGDMLRAEFHRAGGPRRHGSEALIDSEIEAFLKERLLTLYPCGFIGEETAPRTATQGDFWVVDPQDGTADFLAGRRGSAISVALVRDGRPILGVVLAPLAPDDDGDLVSWADGGELARNGKPVGSRELAKPMIVAMNANAADHARHNQQTLPNVRILALPSPAYRLALAAVGDVDAAVSLVDGLDPWDLAGGHALLIGSGGKLCELSGRPIAYDRRGYHGCIGGHPEAVSMLLALSPSRGPKEPALRTLSPRRTADPQLLARAQGCLLGQLAGDALGSAVEFCSAETIARKYPDGVLTLKDGGTWDLIAGQPTDDGEMALALGRSLVAARGYDVGAVSQAYVRWGRSHPFDMGLTTREALKALAAGHRAQSDSQANGALMRVSPIGIAAAGAPALAAMLASSDARLTHSHPICQAASAAYAAAIAMGVEGGDAEAMFDVADKYAGTGRGALVIRERLAQARRQECPDDYFRQTGWVLTAFQNAFYHLARGTPLAEALMTTVARGGDTDTNAAICGALLGAVQGRDAVPLQWRNALLTCRPMDVAGVTHPRPQEYWPDDAMELAEALLTINSTENM
ncbi:ADP-ribosylglycohydrolase family protein [Sinirhodobacter sp. WL0062]|uniref:ADP-ribosylglycohydrolase family protein n=1 Tax=Rhodobacter flavimaris TaxID=2907145 RepID=A0ABS8YRW2_9RHOB|nr:inositol monophosphatase family protein [Sinirhodobacter sp. WL0062]MCE5972433.1 ADP-ribosylglycohydrolase family protein [Sinirhodobacter sp. WL0062]